MSSTFNYTTLQNFGANMATGKTRTSMKPRRSGTSANSANGTSISKPPGPQGTIIIHVVLDTRLRETRQNAVANARFHGEDPQDTTIFERDYTMAKMELDHFVGRMGELVFVDENDPKSESLVYGSNTEIKVVPSFNGALIRKGQRPKFLGLLDGPLGILRAGISSISEPRSTVVIHGKRALVYANRTHTPAYVGDRLRFVLPHLYDKKADGTIEELEIPVHEAGAPLGKVVPEILPANYTEQGDGNPYTAVYEHICHGHNNGKDDAAEMDTLKGELAPMKTFLDGLITSKADNTEDFLNDAEALLDKWSDKLSANSPFYDQAEHHKDAADAYVSRGHHARGNDAVDNVEQIHRLKVLLVRTMMLSTRTHGQYVEEYNASIFAFNLKPAINACGTEVMVTQRS